MQGAWASGHYYQRVQYPGPAHDAAAHSSARVASEAKHPEIVVWNRKERVITQTSEEGLVVVVVRGQEQRQFAGGGCPASRLDGSRRAVLTAGRTGPNI